MKILLFTTDKENRPDVLTAELERLAQTYPRERYGEIVSFVEEKAIPYQEKLHTADYFKENPDAILKVFEDKKRKITSYLAWNASLGKGTVFHIEEVDISIRWELVVCEDGAEFVHYLPAYYCIDDQLNLYSKS